jgi:hypothetical protein
MSPDIHWHVGEDAEQETITTATSPRRSRRSWIAVIIVVILGASLGVVYRSIPEPAPRPTPTPVPTIPPTPTHPALPAKLFNTVDREAQALADGDFDSYATMQRPHSTLGGSSQSTGPCIQCDDVLAWGRPSDGRPLYTIVDFNLHTQTQAWANIRQFRDGRWFLQTRFYQFNPQEDRWLRSEAAPIFSETLDTPHFHAIYFVEDRDYTQSFVQALEEAYPQVCRNLGCTEAATGLTYTLNLNGTSESGLRLSEDARELTFPSPRIVGVFEDKFFDNSYLPWSITVAAVQRAYYDAATQWNGDADGHIVFNAIIRWALQQRGEPNAFPTIAADLDVQKLVPLKNLWGKRYVLDQERQVMVLRADANIIYSESYAVIRFIAQEYGAQSMPKLLKALNTAQSFSDVIETGLGVPFAEFDQKWQAWVKTNLAQP